MEVNLQEITVRDLVENYTDHAEEGVYGYNNRLDIRPPYQREFVYNPKQRALVIDTLTKGFPLNVMYWSVKDDGDYEIIDGQQRTISICQYVHGLFSYKDRYFHNLQESEKEQILNYPLTVYHCTGTDSDKLKWFETINIAGVVLTDQELLNAIYSGPWVTDAKRHFSKTNSPAYGIASGYLNGSAIRQEYLETALNWIASRDKTSLKDYMAVNQHEPNANELWRYFRDVVEWIETNFTNYRSEMKGLPWGILYNKHKNKELNPKELEEKISKLYEDLELKNHKGIYEYILTGDSKHLSFRIFDVHVKKTIFEKQKRKCVHCKKEFPFNQMHADHIKPWSLGGKTIPENCQVLCQSCNAKKSDNY